MPYILMTDTDSALLMFIIIEDRNCDVGEKTMKKKKCSKQHLPEVRYIQQIFWTVWQEKFTHTEIY